jgi:hypothetical protein
VLDELASDHARRRLELDASTVPTHDPDDAAELRALGYLE